MAQFLERVAPAPARGGRIAVKRDGRVNFVRVEDIDWVEADGDLVRVHAGKEAHTIRETMAQIEAKLPAERFMRVIGRSSSIRSAFVKFSRGSRATMC
jgi:DNA-binding LytR/AlgR family response regulator